MLKGLQNIQSERGATLPAIRTTELIVDNDFAAVVREFVKDAQSEIRLCAYAWRWYPNEPEIDIQKLNVELYRARLRGVKVRCLVDTEKMTTIFRRQGFDTRSVVNTRMLHTKGIAIDDKTLFIGSHNLTKRATTDNYEMSILTQEYHVVAGYNDYFDRMWSSRG